MSSTAVRGRREDVDEVLSTLDMEWYLDYEGIDYRNTHGSRGAQLQVKECPCCGKSDWKVYLNAETGLGNCFHGDCQVRFNKWSFIKAHIGADGARAVADHILALGRVLGWQPRRTVTKPVVIDHGEVKIPDYFPLPIDGQNLLYLEKRGITVDLARFFHLGYCHDGWYRFTKPDGTKSGKYFGQRVIIPIFDLDGKLVTFQGRDITGTSDTKYIFPPGLPSTGRYLYNGHNALGAKRVVAGEGAFDVFGLKIAVDAAPDMRDIVPIGTFGMHLSYGDEKGNDQLGALRRLKDRGLQEMIICWDGEAPALTKALDAGLMVKKEIGIRVRVAVLPPGLDPNEADVIETQKAVWTAPEITTALVARLKLRNPYK